VPDHLQAQVTDQIDVGPFPQSIAVGEGGVWVDVPAQSPETSAALVRIDPSTDRVVARIPVPEGESDIAAGGGSVWVTRDRRTLGGQLVLRTLRIDPATNEIVSTIPDVGGQVAVGDGYLWALAAGSDDTTTVLVKIDLGTGSVISSEPLGATVTEIVIGGGSVWLPTLPDPESGTLIQVDASTNQVLHTLRLPFHDAPVFADGQLWVPTCCSNNTVSLVRVDPSTGETVGDPVEAGDGLPFASAFGHVLLMSERGALSDLNPSSGSVGALAKSDWPAAHGTVVFDPVTGSVWVSNYQRTVTRIDVRGVPSHPGLDPLLSLPAGWSELPTPPDFRPAAALAWVGSRVLAWGGQDTELKVRGDGYLWDPSTGDSDPIPAAPIEGRARAAFAWTGSELLVWGGMWGDAGTQGRAFDDGGAYDPSTGSWRLLPEVGLTPRAPLFVWTGTELIVWGNLDDHSPRSDGAAYDPVTDAWRSIADAPLRLTDGTAVWTGSEMIVIGAEPLRGEEEISTMVGAAYDPSSDSWRRLPDAPLYPLSATAAWNGNEVIAMDYAHRRAALAPTDDAWVDMTSTPDIRCEGGLGTAVAVGSDVLVPDCGAVFRFDAATRHWDELSPTDAGPVLMEGLPAYLFSYPGLEREDVALFLATPDERYTPRLFAYRPR
jgi:DNA-binding beta-propeller fold protein YncE